jgi:hypothetical protein
MGEAVTAASTAATTALLIPHLPPIQTLLPPPIMRLRATVADVVRWSPLAPQSLRLLRLLLYSLLFPLRPLYTHTSAGAAALLPRLLLPLLLPLLPLLLPLLLLLLPLLLRLLPLLFLP